MRTQGTSSSLQSYLWLSFFSCCFLGSFHLISQDSLRVDHAHQNIYKVDSKIPWQDLTPFTSVFVDSTNQLDISTVASENFNPLFQPLTSFGQPGEPDHSYWLKIALKGTGDIKDWWILFNNDSISDEFSQHLFVEAWYLDSTDHIIEIQRTGQYVPRSQKAIKENPGINRVPLSIADGDYKILYLRIRNEYMITNLSSLELRNPALGIPERKMVAVFSVLSSVGFLFAVISFFLFFFVKEKSYLFFAVYTLLLSQHYLILHPDLPFVDLYIPEYPQLAGPAFILLTNGGFIFFALFGRYFINLSELSKRLDSILIKVIWVWAVWIVIKSIWLTVMHRQLLPETDFIFIFLFVLFLIRVIFFNNILVRFYVAGALWLIVFTVFGILWNNNILLLPFNPWPVGQLGQLLIYAAGLAYKIRMNEKARTQAELIKLRNVELAGLYAESEKQKDEIEVQKLNAEQALENLKNTQAQLIQSEKMASLGQLTAGIAHEIQNPLNFVNNFSEVNAELINEFKNERIKSPDLRDEKLQDEILQNLSDNSAKITVHGKRAEAIVKGMLHHSRISAGTKEPTDLNPLVDEYLRLAYHGLRAKDKSFNANLITHFDPTIGEINIVPQDIGRVVLNLINNAFYAVKTKLTDKKRADTKSISGNTQTSENYEPTVWVSTKQLNDKIEIRVKDNGDGIPENLWNKIFQPFFTTKPTGQGTGLGLSISYDIIKSQGGELKVASKEGEYAEFIIELHNT